MAKRKKPADRAGKAKPLKPTTNKTWNTKDIINLEAESDAGSFIDDDTEDFLPTKWKKETSKESKESRATTQKQDEAKVLSRIEQIKTDTTAITTSIAALAITEDLTKKIVMPSLPQCSSTPSTEATGCQSKTVLISRLAVPPELLPKPRSTTDELEARITSLKLQLEKKEKDLKASKQQGISLTSELASCQKIKQAHAGKILTLEREKSRLEVENKKLQEKIDKHNAVVKELETNHNAELRTQRKKGKKEHRLQVLDTRKAKAEAEQLTIREAEQGQKIAQLEQELAAKTTSNRHFESSIGQERALNHYYRAQIAQLHRDLSSVREKLVAEREKGLRGASQDQEYRRRYYDVSNQLSQAKQNVANLKDDLKSANRKYDDEQSYRKYVQEILRRAEKSRDSYQRKLNSERERVAELKETIEDQQPLVAVGANVRLRFLEQAAETMWNLDKSDVDRSLIQEGNYAAHRANGERDAALFKCNLVPDDNCSYMKGLFEELYDAKPSEYPRVGHRMSRLKDCEATIKTLRSVDPDGPTAGKRIEHEYLRSRMITIYNTKCRRGRVDDFDSDENVREMLEELEDLSEKIVNGERGRNFRR